MLSFMPGYLVALLVVSGVFGIPSFSLGQRPVHKAQTVEDFESYRDGAVPSRWIYLSRSTRQPMPAEDLMNERKRFYVVEKERNKFLRGYTHGATLRITLLKGKDLDWDLQTHSHLRWDWRAIRLPQGANERSKNDAGAALYVTFDTDWLGRPRSIKYTYSSTLPVGTIIKDGSVHIIVVSSARDGLGSWKTIERNVVEDYMRVFGKIPPQHPLSITLWSDSDTTQDIAEVDFDNIKILP